MEHMNGARKDVDTNILDEGWQHLVPDWGGTELLTVLNAPPQLVQKHVIVFAEETVIVSMITVIAFIRLNG
jgi:hypothetical protein